MRLPLSLIALAAATTSLCQAQDSAPAPASPSKGATIHATSPADAEADYARKLDARCDDIIKSLSILDSTKAGSVKAILVRQYRALRDWQDKNEGAAKALTKSIHSPDATVAAKAKAELEALMATRKALRLGFLADLAKHLSPEQIDAVKDRMTYNKVNVTFSAYCAQNPWLDDTHKARIRAWLIEAREEAIDGGSSEEKSEIFNKYKGRINNYLSKEKPAKDAGK